jgi:hypothetical protein
MHAGRGPSNLAYSRACSPFRNSNIAQAHCFVAV